MCIFDENLMFLLEFCYLYYLILVLKGENLMK